MIFAKNVLSVGGPIDWGRGGQVYVTYCNDYTNHLYVKRELIGFLLALYMATLAKVACFCSLRGEIDFEDLLVLEKDA